MKTIILLSIAVLGSTELANPFAMNSSEQLGQRVVATLRQASPDAYTALFPTLYEFNKIMDENAVVYGKNLIAAKEEFAVHYEQEIIPSLKRSFRTLIREGNKKGIDWSTITYNRVEYEAPEGDLSTISFVIVINTKGKEYRINIEKAFVLHDEWKLGTEIKLI